MDPENKIVLIFSTLSAKYLVHLKIVSRIPILLFFLLQFNLTICIFVLKTNSIFFSDDGEEEFYYTEVEIPSTAPRVRAYTEPASQMANLSLADHLDMARPAHEDPGFPVSSSTLLAASGFRNKIRSFSGNSNKSSLLINQYHHHHHGHHGASGGGLGSGGPASLTTPITIAPSMVSFMTGPAKKLAKY